MSKLCFNCYCECVFLFCECVFVFFDIASNTTEILIISKCVYYFIF